jgi:hypothetical protein
MDTLLHYPRRTCILVRTLCEGAQNGDHVPKDGRYRVLSGTWIGRLTTSVACVLGLLLLSTTNVAAQEGEDDLPQYWELHAWLLTIGTALFVLSYLVLGLKLISRIKGVDLPALATSISRRWYQMHVYLGTAGVALALAGSIWGYLMVDWAYAGEHLRLSHSYIGVAVALVVSAPLVTGSAARILKKGRNAMRWWHLVIGLLGIVLMVTGTISGWALE